MVLQNRVKELRARFDLTQEMLAVKVCVTRQTIAAIEKGSYTPSLLLGIKICDVFQVNVEEVFWISEGEGER
ncbi:putative transcriptional regulator [Metabacillus crassostreae]|uniref:helix-turn-helix transcriptional regulator n=1 Tax=Metabacillus crassostreae TaxID=929098 RepID=UPI0019576BC5|nr:helix-turn-helix transcriptional regulator [Metabacillus crassostreae]MBM7604668.1 putative transcriptional regulator [Metabacillus crassostreae]